MTEKELRTLFEKKLAEWDIPFEEANWEAFEQTVDPNEPLSEQEFRKLYQDKIQEASFTFNPAAWEALESDLGPEGVMSTEEVRQLFENKLSESESTFAYNPDNWARMEHLLDEAEPKPIVYYWRMVAAILILAAGALWMWWPNQLDKPLPTTVGQELQVPVESKNKASEASSSETESIAQELPSSTDQYGGSNAPVSTTALGTTDKNETIPSNSPSAVIASGESRNYQVLTMSKLPWRNLEHFVPTAFALRAYNSQSMTASDKNEPYVPQVFDRLEVMAGPNMSPGFNGNLGNAWQAGLVYSFGLTSKAALELGLVYNQAATEIETIHDSTFFGLSRTNISTHRHYKRIASLRIPVSYRFALSDRHRLSVGAYADAMLRVRMDERVTTTVFKQDPQEEVINYNQSMESFNSFNYGAMFTYTYQYSERLSLGLSYQMGLSDLTNNQAFGFESNHRPDQLNLELRYRIVER